MRVAIVEDEAMVAARLERLVTQALDGRLTSLGVLPSLPAARAYLQDHAVDVLFLDLNLDGRDGFTLLEEAVAGSFATIVVSARHDQALRAFELGVTDFVPKPFGAERIAKSLARVEEREPRLRERLSRLAVPKGGGIELVEIAALRYVSGAGDYSELHLEDGSAPLHSKSLTALEQLLPPRFVRIHRSFLVDLDRARSLVAQGSGRYTLVLDDDTELPVSRARVGELRAQIT